MNKYDHVSKVGLNRFNKANIRARITHVLTSLDSILEVHYYVRSLM
jgi:hypothetical protein